MPLFCFLDVSSLNLAALQGAAIFFSLAMACGLARARRAARDAAKSIVSGRPGQARAAASAAISIAMSRRTSAKRGSRSIRASSMYSARFNSICTASTRSRGRP